jgi:hypothetical protein
MFLVYVAPNLLALSKERFPNATCDWKHRRWQSFLGKKREIYVMRVGESLERKGG